MGSSHHGSGGGYIPRDGLPKLNVGDQFHIQHLESIVKGINRASVVSGEGYQVRRYSNATVIQPNRQAQGGGLLKNFRVFGYVDEGERGFVTCTAGTVNRTVPKISDKYIDDTNEDGTPPNIEVQVGDGYVVIESVYDALYPFPRVSNIKYVRELESLDNNNTSQYPLAKIKFTKSSGSGNKFVPANVAVNQIHIEGNLSVSRVKVGAGTVFWQWWTV